MAFFFRGVMSQPQTEPASQLSDLHSYFMRATLSAFFCHAMIIFTFLYRLAQRSFAQESLRNFYYKEILRNTGHRIQLLQVLSC